MVLEFAFSVKSTPKLASRSSPPIELPNPSDFQSERVDPRGIFSRITPSTRCFLVTEEGVLISANNVSSSHFEILSSLEKRAV